MATAHHHLTVAIAFYTTALIVSVFGLADSVIAWIFVLAIEPWSIFLLGGIAMVLLFLGKWQIHKASLMVEQEREARLTWLEGGRKP